MPNRAIGYMRRGGAWASNTDTLPWRGTAAGGGYSTAGDLFRFAQALESGKLISKAMLAEAITPHGSSTGSASACGEKARCGAMAMAAERRG